MTAMRLGPLLRYVDWNTGDSATIWIEADRPCTAEVRCADGAGGSVRTFQVAGHHYALVPVTGLTPDSTTAYEVLLDGVHVWPLRDTPFPPSTITTPPAAKAHHSNHSPTRDANPTHSPTLRLTFGSCRQAAPPADGRGPHGPDALDTLASQLAVEPEAVRPDVLLLLGDQVYADHLSRATRAWLSARRDLREAPGAQVADFEEYTRLYDESWLDPEIRWLLSTVPSLHIFDDHDVIDDWNTSATWLAEMRATPWWQERVLSGLMSYWVYQHLGNLSPAELAADALYGAVRETPDGTDALRAFAASAEADPATVRWSYRRDFGRSRLLMVDTRAARVLDEDGRAMLDPAEQQWLRDNALAGHGGYDHLLIGSSLPWLMPPLVHDAEVWNAALCRGERGPKWARIGEDLRRRSDLEHWAAFPASFAALSDLIEEVGTGPRAPATVCVLSGDVHHAYVAEPRIPSTARVFQLTCSPVHNSIHTAVKWGFRLGWSRWGRWLGRGFSRHGRTGRPPLSWRRTGGPWFGNQLMTLALSGRSARLRLDQARKGPRLVTVLDRDLTPPGTGSGEPTA
ncbi:alkaline phosphatase family protein [Streptomyces sp. ISL-43]|uniref:alkaline phosphatase D family protein n=1 Tax=Streptomyces sp. ISL-43 TaxID=2819183 RepID=UPI001BEB4425|nr:alkaline phosphatase D family protein [Streptomyces sp. ISL-43]MBT2449974.1 alkaline phosphatase family protein [Streptomyces sp. ISL-43]